MNSIARPWSRWSSASRASTCACTITSSAVVGSSAMSSLGSQASASAISTRWRCPPDSWCGYSLARRAGMPTRSSSSPTRALAPERPDVGVHQDRLFDLAADALHRVERVQRALEHDRRARPAHGAQPARPHLVDVLAVEQHLARRPACPSATAAARRWRWSTCRIPTRRPGPTVSPGSIDRFTPRTAGTGPPSVRYVTLQVAQLEHAAAGDGRVAGSLIVHAAAGRGSLRAPARTS